jgi:hypothetical protein
MAAFPCPLDFVTILALPCVPPGEEAKKGSLVVSSMGVESGTSGPAVFRKAFAQ